MNSNSGGRGRRYISAGKFSFGSRSSGEKIAISDSEFDYKNIDLLKSFLSQGRRMLSKRVTRLSAKQQRKINRQVKLARFLALLPYCDRHK